MLRQVHPVRAPQALIIVLTFTLLVSPFVANAQTREVPQQPLSNGQFESTRLIGESTLLLDESAPMAPTAFGAYRRFGFYVSPVQPLNSTVASLRVLYSSQIPETSAVLIDVRTSADALRWSLWQSMEQSGDMLQLEQLARFAQYRVALMTNQESPRVFSVQLLPQLASLASSQIKAPAPALSFKVKATRQGMIGGRTANGHIITKRDRFVSLPCWCSLSTKNGNEYMVRLTYKGRSTVVPVMMLAHGTDAITIGIHSLSAISPICVRVGPRIMRLTMMVIMAVDLVWAGKSHFQPLLMLVMVPGGMTCKLLAIVPN